MQTTELLIALVVIVLIVLVGVFIMLARLSSKIGKSPAAAATVAPSSAVRSSTPVAAGIAPQVVAAIAGAIAAMEGGPHIIGSIRPVSERRTRGAWGFDGAYTNTRPF
ncbi:MAG: OadG family transporter subunit [Oscillospiraceae bacterium]